MASVAALSKLISLLFAGMFGLALLLVVVLVIGVVATCIVISMKKFIERVIQREKTDERNGNVGTDGNPSGLRND